MSAGTGPVAWTGEDLFALPESAVVNSSILAARRLPGDGEGTWACTDGEVRTSRQLASVYAPLVVLHAPTTDRLARGITGALPRSLDPKDTP